MVVVLIIGMHRSGTSLLANALAAAGVPFGSNLLSHSVPDNPDGYGEHAEVVAIQEQLLRTLGREWHSASGHAALPAHWMDWPETRDARKRLAAIVERELSTRPLWACKDPRTSRLLPLWFDVLGAAGIEVRPVLCIRHPAEVAHSLAVRNGMSAERADAIWMTHQLDIIKAVGARGTPIVAYADILSDPTATLAKILEQIGIRPDERQLQAAAHTVKPALRHHSADPRSPWTPSAALYDELLQLASHPGGRLPAHALLPAGTGTSKVTVVMRTRDRPLFLPRAIRSVLAQTMPDWHLVIVNDGGRQADVMAAIEPYRCAMANRFTTVHLQDHLGMEAASNCAIGKRNDPFVTIHDDDDSWDPRFLQICCDHLASTGAAGVVTASMLAFEQVENGTIVDGPRQLFGADITAITLTGMARKNMFPPIAFVFARKVWEDLDGFRSDLAVLGDWDFNLRFLQRRPITYVPEPLAYWHRRPQQDPYPNSDDAKHERTETALRDEMLRAAGNQGIAMLGVLVPLMERLVSHAPATAPAAVQKSVAPERPPSGPIAPIRLMATSVDQVEQHRGHAMSSTGTDPHLHYDLTDDELWPGTYRVTIALDRPADAGPVELFFSGGLHQAPDRSIVLCAEQSGFYGARFPTQHLVTRLRLDPMHRPGPFEAGPLTISRVAEANSGRLPDFLCIGAQRSGTTWLHHQLRAHGSVFVPPCKELHFFDQIDGIEPERWIGHRLRFLSEAQAALAAAPAHEASAWQTFEWAARFAATRHIDLDWYASLFADAPPDALAGEITPAYALLSPPLVRQITRLIPGLKVIFIMRNPIERAMSGAMHELTTAAGASGRPSERALVAELAHERCFARSAYRRTIETWEGCLCRGSLGCFFYDDIANDPAEFMRSICAFLGIDPGGPLHDDPREPVNRNPLPPPLLGARLPDTLTARYRDDIAWLEQRFGNAVTPWADHPQTRPSSPTSRLEKQRRAATPSTGLSDSGHPLP